MSDILSTKTTFIFDMDGTLIDMEEFTHKAYSKILKKHFDLELSHSDYLRHFSGTRTAEGYRTFLEEKGVKDFDTDELVNDFRTMKRDGLENNIQDVVKLKTGVQEFLKELKSKGYKVGLATSAIKEFTLLIINYYNIKQYFDTIITAEDISKGKPDPQIFNLAVERLGSTKEKSVVFEDSQSGIEAAKAAGIYCVAIHTKGLNDNAVKLADEVIEDYLELLS